MCCIVLIKEMINVSIIHLMYRSFFIHFLLFSLSSCVHSKFRFIMFKNFTPLYSVLSFMFIWLSLFVPELLKRGDVMVSPYNVITCPHMPTRS